MTRNRKRRPPSAQLYTIDSAIASVLDIADTLTATKGIPRSITSSVSEVLIECLRDKCAGQRQLRKVPPFMLLSMQDVRGMAAALVVGNPYSLATLLRYRCLNDMIYQLQFDRVLNSPYFNFPEVIERELLIHMNRDIWPDLKYIRVIQRHLDSLRTFPNWDMGQEEEMVCSFIASAALYSKILFQGFDNVLLSMKSRHFSPDPPVLLLPFDLADERPDAPFYRYFLTPPASNYLMRYFLSQKRKGCQISRSIGYDNPIFGLFVNKPWRFSPLFKAWTRRIILAAGLTDCGGLTPSRFRKAALYSAVIDTITSREGCGHYPPFLISIQNRTVTSSSFYCKFLPHDQRKALPDPPEVNPNATVNSQEKRDRLVTETSPTIVDTIRSMVYRLLRAKLQTGKAPTRSERRQVAADIRGTVASSRSQLSDADFENADLLAEWHAILLINSKPDIKTINNYASDVKGFFSYLPHDRPLYSLRMNEIEEALDRTLVTHPATALKGIRSFLNFIKSCHQNLELPRWGRAKWLAMVENETAKPFISFRHVEEALGRCEAFFCSRAIRYKDAEKARIAQEEAKHKAFTLFHMTCLGFYGGLRASEFAHLLIENVIYDGGITICIRNSKTRNGWRNIPLSLLAPGWYVDKLETYYNNRRETETDFKEPLFPRIDGTFWRSSYLSANVGKLFKSIGIPNMRFHHLRHSFANWFILRWFVAFFPDYAAGKLLTHLPLFDDDSIRNVRRLILGPYPKSGEEFHSHVLAILARLIGHGGPLTTMKNYLHVGDWLFLLLSERLARVKVKVSSVQAQDFLQVSYPSLPEAFKGRIKKVVTFAELLSYQTENYLRKFRVSNYRPNNH